MKAAITLIDKIQKTFKDYFDEGLYFHSESYNVFVNDGSVYAKHKFDIPIEEVKVKHWFDDIWFFIKISFMSDKENKKLIPFISISFFQETGNDQKDQMFRAEWDNYLDCNTKKHPQPHWHITSTLAVEKSIEDLINENDENDPANIFAELIMNEKKDLLNIPAFHFAMGGDWIKDGNMITKLSDDDQIVLWMKYLFQHVRYEIEYIKREVR